MKITKVKLAFAAAALALGAALYFHDGVKYPNDEYLERVGENRNAVAPEQVSEYPQNTNSHKLA